MRRLALLVCVLGIAGISVPIAAQSAQATTTHTIAAEVGSADYLVYVESGVGLVARSSNGHTWKLPDALHTQVSLSGHYLVESGTSKQHARWWNLATHKHGVIPHGDPVAAPHGWALESGKTRVVEITPSGKRQTLARVSRYWALVPGPKGLLLYDDSAAKYVPWDRPGHPQDIDVNVAQGASLTCENVNAFGAGCYTEHDARGDRQSLRAVLLRWSDDTGTSVKITVGSTISPYVVGHALAWWNADDDEYGVLRSGKTTLVKSSVYSGDPVAAYDRVVLNKGSRALVQLQPGLTDPHLIKRI